MFANWRQWRYPKEFRIDPPIWPEEAIASIEPFLRTMRYSNVDRDRLTALVRDVANGLWRAQKRLNAVPAPGREIRGAERFLEGALDALIQAGYEIRDHNGERVTGGEALRVIAYETSDHVTHAKVVETVKPTILHRKTIVQLGEVIVGQPSGAKRAKSDRAAARA